MSKRPELVITLLAGQSQQILIEAGSSLILAHGALRIGFPFVWLAEHTLARDLQLSAGEMQHFEEGGWIQLHAGKEATQVMILPPQQDSAWSRLLKKFSAEADFHHGKALPENQLP